MSSVARWPYYPEAPEAPLLEHRGPVQCSGVYSTAGSYLSSTYAITDHFAVNARASYSPNRPDGYKGEQLGVESSVGYYRRWKSLVQGVYLGGGWNGGHYYGDYSTAYHTLPNPYSIDDRYNSWYVWLQGDEGWHNDFAAIAVFMRANYIRMSRTEQVTPPPYPVEPGFGYQEGPYLTTFYITPGIEGRFGPGHTSVEGTVYYVMADKVFGVFASVGLVYKF